MLLNTINCVQELSSYYCFEVHAEKTKQSKVRCWISRHDFWYDHLLQCLDNHESLISKSCGWMNGWNQSVHKNLHSLQGSSLSLITSSTDTQNKTLGMGLSWDHFTSSLHTKTHIWPQKLGYVGFQEKFDTPLLKPAKTEPCFQKSQLILYKTRYAFSCSPPGQGVMF